MRANLDVEPAALSRSVARMAGPAAEIVPGGLLPVPRGGSSASLGGSSVWRYRRATGAFFLHLVWRLVGAKQVSLLRYYFGP